MLESEFYLHFWIRVFDFKVRAGLVIGAPVLYADSHPHVSVPSLSILACSYVS